MLGFVATNPSLFRAGRWTKVCTSCRPYASALPRKSLLSRAATLGIEKEIAERVMNVAERAYRDWTVCVSDFLTPPEAIALHSTLSQLVDLHVVTHGGYDGAERSVLAAARAEIAEPEELTNAVRDDLALLSIDGNFLFDTGSCFQSYFGVLYSHSSTR